MEKEVKYIDAKEFREKGYLQEVNRRFFHPLGLALEIRLESDGTESFGAVWDYRNDDEGIYYDIANSDKERKERFNNNKAFIDSEILQRSLKRKELLGFDVEPVE